jgi:hypothetical protein
MMLDAEGMIEADLVAQFQLTPKLFVALMRRHAGLGPDMGKMREFHEAKSFSPLSPCGAATRSLCCFTEVCKGILPASRSSEAAIALQ